MGAVVNNRLEAHTRGTDLLPGLQACVHDALWLLARQWQLGELDGLDAGTPIATALVTRSVPLATWQPAGGTARTYDGSAPLEALVESDGEPLAWPDRVSAGLRLARALRRAGVDPAKLLAAHPLAAPDPAITAAPDAAEHATSAVTPSEVAAGGAVVTGRVIDAGAVATAYDADLAALVTAAGGEPAQPVIAEWKAWWDARRPPPSGAWQPGELAHEFTAATADPSLPTFQAERFTGGTLDWYAFDTAPGTGTPATSSTVTARAVPVPVGFHGAPVGRYWQLEDARTDLGAIDTYPTELAKLLLAEFTACFAANWFRVAARVPYGSAATVETLVSTDTFGISTLVRSASAAGASRTWRMFEHSDAAGVDTGWLLVPPVLAGAMESAPLEEVALVRDVADDLAWGIETVVTNAVGRPVRRADDLAAQGRGPAPDPRDGLPGAWVWRLATSVPENWVPFLPTRGRAEDDDFLLLQGAMIRYVAAADGAVAAVPILPAGLLLANELSLAEREIPREGVTLHRTRKLARWVDGGRVQWWSRNAAVGQGEASSGLAYDGLHTTSADPNALGD